MLCSLTHVVPLTGCYFNLFCTCRIDTCTTLFTQFFYEFSYRFCALCIVVVVTVEHLDECPLCPVVVFSITCPYLAVPIKAETYLVELFTVTVDILLGCYCRVLSCLDGILFCRESVCIVTHWVKHVVTLKALETREDIRCYITKRMTYMQACTRWVREHVKYIEFLLLLILNCAIGLVLFPSLLPLLFNLVKIVCHISIFYFRRCLYYYLHSRCNKLQKYIIFGVITVLSREFIH